MSQVRNTIISLKIACLTALGFIAALALNGSGQPHSLPSNHSGACRDTNRAG